METTHTDAAFNLLDHAMAQILATMRAEIACLKRGGSTNAARIKVLIARARRMAQVMGAN